MKVRFLFHKGKDSWVGRAIVIWTWILGLFYNWKVLKYNYSHEEVWLPSKAFGDFEFIPTNKTTIHFVGRCFSSTTRGDAEGVRIAPASEVLHHPERWVYIEVEVDDKRLEIVVQEAEKLARQGLKYDFLALFGFFLPFVVQVVKRWYCSEICDWLKYLSRIIPKRHKRISPRRAAYELAKKWHEPKPLE